MPTVGQIYYNVIDNNSGSYASSKEDIYMMNLLANITKLFIEKKQISYKDLYSYDEEELWSIIKISKD